MLLLGVPAEVFQVVVMSPNQRGCVAAHMSFKTRPGTGGRYCLRKPEGASAEENVAQSPLCLHGDCAHAETIPVLLVKSSISVCIVVKSRCFSRVNETSCHSRECRMPPLLMPNPSSWYKPPTDHRYEEQRNSLPSSINRPYTDS